MEFWTDKRVLVTGATGMVGSWLCRWLASAGAQTVALVADWDPQSELLRGQTVQSLSVVNGRLEDYGDVERAINNHEVDSIFHLGAQPFVAAAHRAPRHTFESNIQGTWNLLEAVRSTTGMVKRVVIASSDKAYGTQPVLPYTEDMPLQGVQPYEVSKSCTDLIARSYAITFGLPITIARCGNIYGGGDLNWNRIVPGTFRSLLRATQPVLRSDGKFVRDYLHVDDVVKAYVLLGQRSHEPEMSGEAFNFSNEQPLSVMDIYREICIAAGQPDVEPFIANTVVGEIHDQYLDASKAQHTLGWQASIGLSEGLQDSFGWYKKYLSERHG